MNYLINKSNVKKSISRLSNYLKEKGYHVPYSVITEGFSNSLFFRNWNTLEENITSPKQIHKISKDYRYLLEITIDLPKEKLLTLLKESLIEANTTITLENIRHEGHDFYIEINLMQGANNVLTAFFLFSEKLKKINILPTRLEHCRIHIEKESWMAMFKNSPVANPKLSNKKDK